MVITEFTGYKTSDSKLFEAREEAVMHERGFALFREVDSIVDKGASKALRLPIYTFIIEHKAQLYSILYEYNNGK